MNYQTTLEIELALVSYRNKAARFYSKECRINGFKIFNCRRMLVIPNVSWGLDIHECDLLIVSNSGYAIEVEIKISKADLIKDLEKRHMHESNKIKYLYFAIPSRLAKYIEYIPKRAGILIVNSKGQVWEIAKPIKNKSCRKLTEKEMFQVARLGALRIWTLKKNILKLTNQKSK